MTTMGGGTEEQLHRTNSTAEFGGGGSKWKESVGVVPPAASSAVASSCDASGKAAKAAARTAPTAAAATVADDSSYGSDTGGGKSGIFTLELSGVSDAEDGSLSDYAQSRSSREERSSSGDDDIRSSSGDNKGGSGSGGSSSGKFNKSSSSNDGGSAGPFGRIIRPSDYISGGGAASNEKRGDGTDQKTDATSAARAKREAEAKPSSFRPKFIRPLLFASRTVPPSERNDAAAKASSLLPERRPSFVGRRNFSAVMDAQDAVERRSRSKSKSQMGAAKQKKEPSRRGSDSSGGGGGGGGGEMVTEGWDKDDAAKRGQGQQWRRMSLAKRVCVAVVAVAGVVCVAVAVALPDSPPAAMAREAIQTLVKAEENHVSGAKQGDAGMESAMADAEQEGEGANRELDDLNSNSTTAKATTIAEEGNREMEEKDNANALRGTRRPHMVGSMEPPAKASP